MIDRQCIIQLTTNTDHDRLTKISRIRVYETEIFVVMIHYKKYKCEIPPQ